MGKTVATAKHIAFAKRNYLKMTAADIDKKFNVSSGVTRRIYKRFSLVVPVEVTYRLRAKKQEIPFTKKQDNFIKKNIAKMSYKEIAKKIERCALKTRERCHQLGFTELMQEKSRNSRFGKGHEPFYKGKKIPDEIKAKMSATHFKKGHIPHNAKEDGSISVRLDSRGIPYMHYRVEMSHWIPLHHKIWMDENGPVPKGHNIIFKNGDTMDVRLENLECLSNAENMMRNTIQRFPDELKTNIRKISKLKRIIKNKESNEQSNI